MEEVTELRANVNKLTREHVRLYEHEQRMESGMVPGLIQQLRLEQGISNDGAGTSSGKPIPLNTGPFDLLQRITTALQEELKPFGLHPISLEKAIRTWARLCEMNADLTTRAASLTGRWVDDITVLFDPPKKTDVKGDCPECKGTAQDNGRLDDDDHWIPVAPLTRVKDVVTCSMCGERWAGQLQLTLLVWAIDHAAEKAREEAAKKAAEQEEEAADTSAVSVA